MYSRFAIFLLTVFVFVSCEEQSLLSANVQHDVNEQKCETENCEAGANEKRKEDDLDVLPWGMELVPVQPIKGTGLFTGTAYKIVLPKERPSDDPAILSFDENKFEEMRNIRWFYGQEALKIFGEGGPRERDAQFMFLPQFHDHEPVLINLAFPHWRFTCYGSSFSHICDMVVYKDKGYYKEDYSYWGPKPHPEVKDAYTLTMTDPNTRRDKVKLSAVGEFLTAVSHTVNQKDRKAIVEAQKKRFKNKGRRFREVDAFQFVLANSVPQARIVEFEYPADVMQQLRNQSKRVTLVATEHFINPSNAVIKETQAVTKQKTETFTYGFTETLTYGFKLEVKVGIPLIAQGTVTTEAELNLDANQEWTNSNTKTYKVAREIELPPYYHMDVTSCINWVDNMRINYAAILEITVKILRFSTDFRDTVLEDAPPGAIEKYLQHNAPDLKILRTVGKNTLVRTYGTITGKQGVETFTVAKKVYGNNPTTVKGENPIMDSSRKTVRSTPATMHIQIRGTLK